MKKVILSITIISALGFGIYWASAMPQFAKGVKEDTRNFETKALKNQLQNGDIIFQISKSSQSKAIQLATNSKYSHMGIVYEIDGHFFVYEAIQTVRLTPLNDWINRGKNGYYVVKRLKNAAETLTQSALMKMKQIGNKFKGKKYDLYFEWSDDKIYCSELVWKIYKEAIGIEIGKLAILSDFDLTSSVVQQKMKERYGNKVPMDEKVISPAEMFEAANLKMVLKK